MCDASSSAYDTTGIWVAVAMHVLMLIERIIYYAYRWCSYVRESDCGVKICCLCEEQMHVERDSQDEQEESNVKKSVQ